MSKKNDNDDINLILDDYQEIEDYTVNDVFDLIDEQENKRSSRKHMAKIKKQKKMKRRRRLKVALLVLEIFVVLILGLVATVLLAPKGVRNDMISCAGKCAGKCTGIEGKTNEKFHVDIDEDEIKVNEELDVKEYEKYKTIALFGIDSRENSLDVGLSDSIIIVTVNMDMDSKYYGQVRMCSIARDTYLSIVNKDGDASYNRINAAFSKGGVELALTNLNRNLDIAIDEFVVVNFAGLSTIIDAFGGLDVTITKKERDYINGYLVETRKVTGLSSPDVYDYGDVHLNGLQATAYCRIRQTTFTDANGEEHRYDFGRTARQRYVLQCLVNKAQSMKVDNVIAIANELFGENEPAFKTSMTYDEIMDLLPVVLEFTLQGTQSFPYDYVPMNNDKTNDSAVIIVKGLYDNATKLHEFLYPDREYKATATLKTISHMIEDEFGVEAEEE